MVIIGGLREAEESLALAEKVRGSLDNSNKRHVVLLASYFLTALYSARVCTFRCGSGFSAS